MPTYNTELTAISKTAFRDFSLDLKSNPKTGDILLKSTSDSIKQSIRNLMLTNFYSRPFRPYLGSNLTASLFSLPSPEMVILMQREIIRLIRTHEPRVTDVSVGISIDSDNQIIRAKVGYLEVGIDINTTLDVLLSRGR